MSAPKTTAFTEVPLVDVSGLQSDKKPEREAVAARLRDVASTVGFLYATGHGVSDEAIAGIQEAAKEFFALPEEERMQVYIGSNPGSKTAHKGYVPEGEEVFGYGGEEEGPPTNNADTPDPPPADHKSAFDFGFEMDGWEDHPLVKARTPLLGFNQWPKKLGPEWKAKCLRYYQECFAFGLRLWHGFALALGLDEDALDKMVTFPATGMRMIHYPHTPEDPAKRDAPGIGAHTDYEYFTILLPTAPGLEVLNGEGAWIDVPPIPNTYVVNIADSLEILSAGKMVATTHRVRPVQEERYSFPMFFSVDYHTLVKPLPELLPPGDQAAAAEEKKKPVVIGDHVWSMVAKSHRYGIKGLKTGEIVLPEDAHRTGLFGRKEAPAA